MGICSCKSEKTSSARVNRPNLSRKSIASVFGLNAPDSERRSSTVYRAGICDELFSPTHRRMSTRSLFSIMDNEFLRGKFETFIMDTQSPGAQRKVTFWNASLAHEMIPHDSDLRVNSAQKIYDEFFSNPTTCYRDLDIDNLVIEQIRKTLNISESGKVTQQDSEVLRAAFAVASGRVFNDLKYIYMPKFLESNMFKEIVHRETNSSSRNSYVGAKLFQNQMLGQKTPVLFVLSKPHTKSYFLQFIATMKIDSSNDRAADTDTDTDTDARVKTKNGNHSRKHFLRIVDLIEAIEDLGAILLNEKQPTDNATAHQAEGDRLQERHQRILKRYPDLYTSLLDECTEGFKIPMAAQSAIDLKEDANIAHTQVPGKESLALMRRKLVEVLEHEVMPLFHKSDLYQKMQEAHVRSTSLEGMSTKGRSKYATTTANEGEDVNNISSGLVPRTEVDFINTYALSQGYTTEEKQNLDSPRESTLSIMSLASASSLDEYRNNVSLGRQKLFSAKALSQSIGGQLTEDEAELLSLLAETHGQYHFMKFARSRFQEENVTFLAATQPERVMLSLLGDSASWNKSSSLLTTAPATAETMLTTNAGEGNLNIWINNIRKRFVEPGSEMEINLSSSLRRKIISRIKEFSAERETNNESKESGIFSEKVKAVHDILKPARKEVLKMLASGVSGLFQEFKTTPMYAVTSELRTIQLRGGQQRTTRRN